MGYSQFNELLLILGYDRVSPQFFQFLIDETIDYRAGEAFRTFGHLQESAETFQKLALLRFGNVKFAFKTLSRDVSELEYWWNVTRPRSIKSFQQRHRQIQEIERIPGEDTYFLGYLVQKEMSERLRSDPSDQVASASEQKRKSIVAVGERNQHAYLVSDHLDVYIATSMRERHEYLMVHRFVERVFAHPRLARLNVRYFDPTQAYCRNRIDKGLSEALMLKRAKCTIYLAQEIDTLGKDSELACTLAQGKPVVAYVPEATSDYFESMLAMLRAGYPERPEVEVLLDQLEVFDRSAAWKSREVQGWVNEPKTANIDDVRSRLFDAVKRHYDRRFAMLRDEHPLGMQVNLETGVANGVLVVRDEDKLAELVANVLLGDLRFELERVETDGISYLFLRESLSGCVFRVMTGNGVLANSFWNFYLRAADEA